MINIVLKSCMFKSRVLMKSSISESSLTALLHVMLNPFYYNRIFLHLEILIVTQK